jgi:hypothetical protein
MATQMPPWTPDPPKPGEEPPETVTDSDVEEEEYGETKSGAVSKWQSGPKKPRRHWGRGKRP